MEIRIITVGKIKEKYLSDGIAEYAKRLSRYCKLTFCQVADEKTPDKASEALNIQIKDTEGERLMKHIREQDYVIALAIDGKMLDSVELSEKIEIVKYIVNEKLAEKKAKEDAKKNREMKQRLLEIKAKRQDAALEGLSDAELDKMIQAME